MPVRELAGAAGHAARLAAEATEPQVWPLDQARAELSPLFADALALDQAVTSDAARRQLGWRPQRPDAVAELRHGSYRQ